MEYNTYIMHMYVVNLQLWSTNGDNPCNLRTDSAGKSTFCIRYECRRTHDKLHTPCGSQRGREWGKWKLQAKMGWHLCTFQRPFVALRKYLTCISSTFKRRQREREIEVSEKSQKSTAGITLRTFKYEYMWISKWISHKLIDKVCSNLINFWNLSTEIFQIMKPIKDLVSIEYLLVEQ